MSTPPPIAPLGRAQRRLEARLRRLDDQLDRDPDNERAWQDYVETAKALAAIAPATEPPMISTKQLAETLGVSTDTVRDMVKDGRLSPAAKFGNRGGYRFHPKQKPT